MVTLDFAATILLAADRRSGLRCIYPFSTAALSHPPVFTGTCAIVAPIRGCRPSSGNGAGPDRFFFCPSLRSCSGPPQVSSPVQ
jgi:hypothetical protein